MRHRAKAPIDATETADLPDTGNGSAGVTVLPRRPLPAWARHADPESLAQEDLQTVDSEQPAVDQAPGRAAAGAPAATPSTTPEGNRLLEAHRSAAEPARGQSQLPDPGLARALSEFAGAPAFAQFGSPAREPQQALQTSKLDAATPELPGPRSLTAPAGLPFAGAAGAVAETGTLLAPQPSFGMPSRAGFPEDPTIPAARRRHAGDRNRDGSAGWSEPAEPPAFATVGSSLSGIAEAGHSLGGNAFVGNANGGDGLGGSALPPLENFLFGGAAQETLNGPESTADLGARPPFAFDSSPTDYSPVTPDVTPNSWPFLSMPDSPGIATDAATDHCDAIDPDPESALRAPSSTGSPQPAESLAPVLPPVADCAPDAPNPATPAIPEVDTVEPASEPDAVPAGQADEGDQEPAADASAKSGKGALAARVGVVLVTASLVGTGVYFALTKFVFTDEVDATAATLPASIVLPEQFGELGATRSPQADLRLTKLLGMPRRTDGLTTAGGYAFAPGTPVKVAAKVSAVPGAFGTDELGTFAKRTGAKLGKPVTGTSGTTNWTCTTASGTKANQPGSVCAFIAGPLTGQSYVLGATPEKAGSVTANLVAQLR